MSVEIPHVIEPHPVTGVPNAKLGIWLFLASEVMLFGALFSSYVLLRVGADVWPPLDDEGHPPQLNILLAMINTFVLITSSVTMVMAWASLKMNDWAKFTKYQLATIGLALTFMVIKYFEYTAKFSHHIGPDTNIFYGLYFTMTGLHGLHVIGGVIVLTYLLVFGKKMWLTKSEQFTNRVECTGLYWHFVDLVWIFLFPTLYLLP